MWRLLVQDPLELLPSRHVERDHIALIKVAVNDTGEARAGLQILYSDQGGKYCENSFSNVEKTLMEYIDLSVTTYVIPHPRVTVLRV